MDGLTEPVIRAAGGVVWRQGRAGPAEVVVVHRPKYDDWSLPKGKCDPGEGWSACALREVWEETGYRCVLGLELPRILYTDNSGRPKEVRYWIMALESLAGDFVPNAEVDQLRWCGVDDARALLSYARDREVLTAFATAAGAKAPPFGRGTAADGPVAARPRPPG